VDEYRLGYQLRLGSRGYFKADFIMRDFKDFYVDFRNLQTGPTANGRGDLEVITNDDSLYERNYHAVQLQGRYSLTDRLTLLGNYTWSQLYGNIDGEDSTGVSSTAGTVTEYPEYNSFEQRNPSGYLPGDQRHVARLFALYDWRTSFGDFTFAATERYETGTPYAATLTIPLTGGFDEAYGFVPRSQSGYVSPPTSTTYYVQPRGANRADNFFQTDLGINWEIKFNRLSLFLEIDVFNIFNQDSAPVGRDYNNTVIRLEPFNVFTETPVEGVHYQLDDDFGTPDANAAFQNPRTFRFDLGLKF
jgi:hypothetical protein